MGWIIYRSKRPSNDLGWLRTSTEILERLLEDDEAESAIFGGELEAAMDAAREAGWDGHMDEEPHAFILPSSHEFRYGFVWTSPDVARPMIVASPLPLPWMEEWR